jgi:hypothetical protein
MGHNRFKRNVALASRQLVGGRLQLWSPASGFALQPWPAGGSRRRRRRAAAVDEVEDGQYRVERSIRGPAKRITARICCAARPGSRIGQFTQVGLSGP